MSKYLKFIALNELDKWYVSYYLNPNTIKSKYPLIKLQHIIEPLSIKIKKNDYDGKLPVVSKISFKDGCIHLRDDNSTGMDLYFMPKNELLVSKINFHQGAVAINNKYELVCSTHYQPYEINYEIINNKFLTQVLRSNGFLNFIKYLRADGIKNEATYEFIKNLKIPLPSLIKQKEFLKNYNNKIALAEKQEQEAKDITDNIEIFFNKEIGIQKNTIDISKHKNLLKTIEYSEIEKWGVDKLNTNQNITYTKEFTQKNIQSIATVSSGGTPSRSNKEYYTGKIPWIKTGEVVNNIILNTQEKITEEAIKNSSAKIYPKGSLIIAMYGQGLTRGRTAKLGIDASTNQACAVLSNIDNDLINTDYLWFYLMNEYHRLRELASGNNQPNLNAEMVKNYKVIIPPFDIQDNIVIEITKRKKEIKRLKNQAVKNRENAIKEFEEEIFTV